MTYWTVVLPVMVTEPTLTTAPAVANVQEWALDTGNRGEAFAWRHHLVAAGLDPAQGVRPLIGVRAMRSAGLKVEIDFAGDAVSVWRPDPVP